MELIKLSLNAIAPMFCTIFIGYFVKRIGVIKESEQPRMSSIGFKIFLPVLLFYNIYSTDVDNVGSIKLLVYSIVSILVIYFIVTAIVLAVEKDPAKRGVMIQAIYRSNYVLLGLPIATSFYADAAGVASMVVAVIIPLFNILAVVTLEIYSGGKVDVKHILLDIIKNPLIVASLLGILLMALGIKLPAFAETVIRDLSKVSTPYLLMLLGVFFNFKFKIDKALVLSIVGKLIFVPALGLSVAALLGFRGAEFAVLLALFASPPATSSFTMAQQLGGDARLAGNSLILGSALSFFTLLMWVMLFKQLGIF